MRLLNKILAMVAVVLGVLVLTNPAAASLSYTFTSGTDVAVTGSNYVASGALNLTLGFAPTPGTNLTVVKNTGLPFISGTFNGVPQGGTVPLSYNGQTYNYIANYYGGNGRSLVLQWPCMGLAAWGAGSSGQLGNNSTSNSTVPVGVNTRGVLAGKTVVAIASGDGHSLALTSDGKVYTWGYNYYGQLGNNTSGGYSSVPVAVDMGGVLAGKTVVAIAAGGGHSLALTSDGKVYGWGSNYWGQLGNNSSGGYSVAPVGMYPGGPFPSLTVVAIAGGGDHTLALTSNGQLFAWGYGMLGQLGNDRTVNLSVASAVITSGTLAGKTVTNLAGGDAHSLALSSDGQVFTWGNNSNGQLGNNSTGRCSVPVGVITSGTLAGKTVTAIAGNGADYSLALTSDGKVFAWGYNYYGQLGNKTKTNSLVPVGVVTSGTLAGKTAMAIAGGMSHGLALTSDGLVFAWGGNTYGQLGNNSTAESLEAAVTSNGALAGKTVVAISAGSAHSLALVGSGPPLVTANPVNRTGALGASVTFTAAATDIPAPTVKWQVSTTGTAEAFTDIVGNATATTGTLTLPDVTSTQNGYAYRAVFTNKAGSCTTTAATLTVRRTFAWFQGQYGLLNADPTADPNHTGVCHLAAYAFGVNPAAPDRAQLPWVTLQNGGLQISYPRWKDAADLGYVVEVSDDLLTWHSGVDYTEQVSVTAIDAMREQVVERDLVPIANAPRRFIRVRITY